MAVRPPGPPGADGSLDAPVLLTRRRLVPPPDGGEPEFVGPKVLEATSLRGRELRWQPWPDVAPFNEAWRATPMKWGTKGELFVLLKSRSGPETRVCAAEVHLPLESWPVLSTSAGYSATAKYTSFTFNEHLFLISLDREEKKLKAYHVPDPSAAWSMVFEAPLADEPSPSTTPVGEAADP